MRVAAALQKQAIRDLAPIWEISATVDAFEKLEHVPLGYWPIVIMDNIRQPGAAGVHKDDDGQPFALVAASDTVAGWALTASHETLEMLVDPFGNRLVAGESPAEGQGRVEFLVEVCDPSEDASFGYTVNDIRLSDFYTPRYFDPVTAAGVRYSFTGAITRPREVLRGGYLSWHEPVSDHWFQLVAFDGPPHVRDIGRIAGKTESLRVQIDRQTERDRERASGSEAAEALSRSEFIETRGAASRLGSEAAAERLQAQIEKIVGQPNDEQGPGRRRDRSGRRPEPDKDAGRELPSGPKYKIKS